MTNSRKKASRVDFPYLIRDRQYLREDGDLHLATPLQIFSALDDGSFRDGPVHPRVAIVDLDANTRSLRKGASFQPQGIGKTVSCYDLSQTRLEPEYKPEDFETDSFLQVNPFATILKTLDFFEGPEMLGRTISWAFPSTQILVVPRSGEMKNAFYDRESGSLQLFYHPAKGNYTVYTALSHDIVVHETTHAILDGVAPDLYDAVTPQSLAMHEALADVSAITQTLLNEMVVFSIGAISSSSMDPLVALSKIAEEFGSDTRKSEGASFLRRMKNQRTLDPKDTSLDEFGWPNRPEPTDPHALSQVLSGAIYAVFEMRMKNTHRTGDEIGAQLEEVFCPAARRVARIVFRALDYLPPGEASFADYGRAFLAAARTTYKRPEKEQQWLIDEFVRRGIVDNPAELISSQLPELDLKGMDLRHILDDDTVISKFAEAHRAQLGIPKGFEFEVLKPVIASRSFGDRRASERSDELILRFRWKGEETHDLGGALPRKWATVRGTTLVIDRATGRLLSLLTTDSNEKRTAERGALLRRWVDEGRLLPEVESQGPDGKPLMGAVVIKLSKGLAQAGGGGRTLHIAAEAL